MDEAPLEVFFEGPFVWKPRAAGRSLFKEPISKKKGLYLWTIPQKDSELIYYVGITQRSFYDRMTEHFKEHCAGAYHLNNPDHLKKGVRECLWPGLYDKTNKKSIVELSERYETLVPLILQLLDTYHFYLAPMEIELRLLERIEARLARHLYDQTGQIGKFQEKDIYYKGRSTKEEPIWVSMTCQHRLCGLPKAIEV